MKKMYIEPQTEVVAVETAMSLCHVSADRSVKINNDIPFNGKVI